MNAKNEPQPTLRDDIAQMYLECMEEVKLRTGIIDGFWQSKFGVKYIATTVESVCLQFRMILELIALASLVANKSEYEKHRKNFYRDWNGERIMKTLEKANPEFYPCPLKPLISLEMGTEIKVIPITSGYLTREDYAFLYDQCGDILHASNPFVSGRGEKIQSFADNVPKWMKKIQVLLHYHYVQLIEENKRILVVMKTKDHGKVGITTIYRKD